MKKHSLLAYLTVFVLCLTMVMTGCQDDAKSGKQENASITLEQAAANTMEALAASDCSIGVLENMNEKKVITVALEDQFTSVLKMDLPNKAFYDELSFTAEGQAIDLNLYCNGTDLAITAPDLMGSDQALGVNLQTLATDLESSPLWNMIDGGSDGALSVLPALLGQYETLSRIAAENTQRTAQELNSAMEGLDQTQENGTVSVYGEDVNAVIFTCTADQEDIKKLTDIILNASAQTYAQTMDAMVNAGILSSEEAEENIYEDMQAELNKVFEASAMEAVVKFAVNPDNGCIMLVDTTFNCSSDRENTTVTAELVLGKNPAESGKYTISMDITANDSSILTLQGVLSTASEGSVDTASIELDVNMNGEKSSVTMSGSYDNESHGYELAMVVDNEQYAISGQLESTDTKLLLTVDELTSNAVSQPLGLTITIEPDPDCEIPQVPAYTNILTDLDLGSLFGAMYAG